MNFLLGLDCHPLVQSSGGSLGIYPLLYAMICGLLIAFWDPSKWFKLQSWKDRMYEADEKGILVLLDHLDSSYTSTDVELGGGFLFGLPMGFVTDFTDATIAPAATFLLGRTVLSLCSNVT